MANLQKLRAKAFVLATKMGLAAEAYWATVKPAVYYAFYQCQRGTTEDFKSVQYSGNMTVS